MKKIFIAGCIATFLLSASFTFAQSSEGQGNPPPHPGFFQTIINVFRGNRQADTQTFQEVRASTTENYHNQVIEEHITASSTVQFREERASTTADYRQEKQDNRKDLRTNLMSVNESIHAIQMLRMTWMRINATAIRLQKILANLNSRIGKINASGGDTTVAVGFATTASTTLSVAQTDITNVKAIIDAVSSTSPLAVGATTTISADFKDGQIQLQTSQKNMEQAVANLIHSKFPNASSTLDH